jgi:putative hemolysin
VATVSLPFVVHSTSFVSFARGDPPLLEEVNPAAAHCTNVGGTVIIHTRGDGAEYGLCQFTDNRACEEWALFHGQCPVGGVKITGFDTIAQQYCAWLGGETLAVPQANCTLPNGNVCNDNALYDGACS